MRPREGHIGVPDSVQAELEQLIGGPRTRWTRLTNWLTPLSDDENVAASVMSSLAAGLDVWADSFVSRSIVGTRDANCQRTYRRPDRWGQSQQII